MNNNISSEQFRLRPQTASQFREEILISPSDLNSVGLRNAEEFGILSIVPPFPGPPDRQFAVRMVPKANLEPGNLLVNQNFLDFIGFRAEDERFWSIRPVPSVMPITEAVLELVVEQDNIGREIDTLRHERRDLFLNRCLLIEPGQTVNRLSLPVTGRGYFNFRFIQPELETIQSNTVLIIDDSTTLNLYVPYRKGGVDMVIAVDASNSMNLADYVGADNRVHARLDGVRVALDTLFQRRLISGSRVSRIAAVAFGGNTQMIYPLQKSTMVELKNDGQIEEIRACTRNLSRIGIDRLNVDRAHTNISNAMQYAAELLDYYSQEGNEKMIILLSDGADWTEDTGSVSDGEIVSTAHDPAVLADSLHFDSQVRIHTIAISNEQALRKYEDRKYWDLGWAVPNTRLLRKIADSTEGLFFEQPDACVLTKLFDEIGNGAMYPL